MTKNLTAIILARGKSKGIKNIGNGILSSKIRPAIMQDGGDVKFIKYNLKK